MSSIEVPVVGPDALDEIVDLCARSVAQPFSAGELRKALFCADQPSIVRFRRDIGIVATCRQGADAWVRILASDRDHRGRGNGRRLLEAAESDTADAKTLTIGADSPYFLFPGVPVEETGLCYLLERAHYVREEVNYNVVVDLGHLPEEQTSGEVPTDRDEMDEWATNEWPTWRLEFLRAFDQGGLLVTRDESGIAAACAFDVNRTRTLGPIAARLDLMGKGAARPLLARALRQMRSLGYDEIEVLWVGPIVPYVRVGGTIGRIFFVYRKRR